MELSIFELKTASVAGVASKTGSSDGKPAGEGFSSVFEGCVNGCAGDDTPAEVSAVAVDAATGESVKVTPELEGAMTKASVEVEKPFFQDIKVEDNAALTNNSVKTALEAVSAATVTPKAESSRVVVNTMARVESGVDTVETDEGFLIEKTPADTAKVINPDSAPVAGSLFADVKTTASIEDEDAGPLGKKIGEKTVGQKKTVKYGVKTEELAEENDLDEKEQGADSAQGRRGTVMAGLSPEVAKTVASNSNWKAAVNASVVKPSDRGNETAAAGVESTTGSGSGATEEKSKLDEAVTGKARAAFVIGALDTPASVKSAVVSAVNAAPEVVKSTAVKDIQDTSKEAVGRDGDSKGKDAAKTAAADKKEVAGAFISVKTETADKSADADIELKKTLSPASTEPLHENAVLKAHTDQPAETRVAAAQAESTEANRVDGNTIEQSRTTPVASYADGARQDLSLNNEGKSGGNETGRKTGDGSFAHGVQHISGDKPGIDTQTIKPVEHARPEAVFEKLSTGVRMSLAGNNKDVSISLSPEHLGSMHIKMSVEDSSVKARIIVESEAAKVVLDSDSGKLREVFARHGLTLDRYSVELSTNAFQGGSSQFAGNPSGQPHYGGRGYHSTNFQGPEATSDTTTYRQTENTRRASGGVDIFV